MPILSSVYVKPEDILKQKHPNEKYNLVSVLCPTPIAKDFNNVEENQQVCSFFEN
jgi:hypothetical protein